MIHSLHFLQLMYNSNSHERSLLYLCVVSVVSAIRTQTFYVVFEQRRRQGRQNRMHVWIRLKKFELYEYLVHCMHMDRGKIKIDITISCTYTNRPDSIFGALMRHFEIMHRHCPLMNFIYHFLGTWHHLCVPKVIGNTQLLIVTKLQTAATKTTLLVDRVWISSKSTIHFTQFYRN